MNYSSNCANLIKHSGLSKYILCLICVKVEYYANTFFNPKSKTDHFLKCHLGLNEIMSDIMAHSIV